jgi:hypothetical protein
MYRCLSSFDVENTRFRCNALVHFAGGPLADALDSGNVDKKKKKTGDFGGRVVVELPGGGGERLEGAWVSSGKGVWVWVWMWMWVWVWVGVGVFIPLYVCPADKKWLEGAWVYSGKGVCARTHRLVEPYIISIERWSRLVEL